jgi:acetolactate decarboxylase
VSGLWQSSPAVSLENGAYDGVVSVAEARRHGDLGVGAFDELDGEMVGVDGVFYQVTSDGRAHVAPDSATLPFCMVTSFAGGEPRPLPAELTEATLAGVLDELLGNENFFYSLRIEGTFGALRTRSLPKQRKPYPPLAEVVEHQPTFAYGQAAGTMVGFRAPSYVGRLAPPGYHLHLISADRSFGGHVLSFEGGQATFAFERLERHEVVFPTTAEFTERDCAAAPRGFRPRRSGSS